MQIYKNISRNFNTEDEAFDRYKTDLYRSCMAYREKEKEREIYKKERKIDVCVEGETHTEKKALLGKYENVLVDKKWLEDFKTKYSYWGEVVESLSRYKKAKGVENAEDEPYLEQFAIEDKAKYEPRFSAGEVKSTFDADEFFEAAIARTYSSMED